MNQPTRPILSEEPQLRDHLIDYIAARDGIGRDLARKIIGAMDVHELSVLEVRARDGRLRGPSDGPTRINYEQHRYGLPEIPREPETDYHPFAR